MTYRTYSDLYMLIQALCGVDFASVEKPRITALINSRAERAFRATEYWPRFLKVGEERQVINGIVPFSQQTLSDVDTFLRIYRTRPFYQTSAQEYDFSISPQGAALVIGSADIDTAFVTYKEAVQFNYGDGSQGQNTEIEGEWFQYLAHGTYADWLRSEGQTDKAVVADMEANDKLQDELLRISDTGMLNLIANKVTTVAGMQNRWGNYSYVQ